MSLGFGLLGREPLLLCTFGGKTLLLGPFGGLSLGFGLLGGDPLLLGAFEGKALLLGTFRREALLFRLFGGHAFGLLARGEHLGIVFGGQGGSRGQTDGRDTVVGIFLGPPGRDRFGNILLRLRFRRRALRAERRGFGPAIAQRGQTFGQRGGIRHVRHGCVELRHHVVGHRHGVAYRVATFAVQRRVRAAHAADPDFQRREHLRQRFDAHHRDRAMQGVHRAYQFVVHTDVMVCIAGEVVAHALQMLADLGTQDVQQDRVHHRQARDRRGDEALGNGDWDFGGHGRCVFGQGHPAAHLAHALAIAIGQVGESRRFARGELVGDLHDRVQRRIEVDGLALQTRMQPRQGRHGRVHHVLHVGVRLDGAIEHAVQHVLDLPAELAQRHGADQPPRTFQGVERTTHILERVEIVGIGFPGRQVDVDVGDFLAHLFDENFADFLVDACGILERRIDLRTRALDRFQHFLIGFDPLAGADAGHRWFDGLQRRDRDVDRERHALADGFVAGDGRHRGQDIRGLHGFGNGFAGNGFAENWRDGRCAALRNRPVMQALQTVLGGIEDAIVARAGVAPDLEVVLDTGHGIGQRVHFVDRRYLAVGDQFVADVAVDAVDQFGRAFQIQDAQRTADLGHQLRHVDELLVRPRGFDECGQGILDADKVGAGFAHQRAHDLAPFAEGQRFAGFVAGRA